MRIFLANNQRNGGARDQIPSIARYAWNIGRSKKEILSRLIHNEHCAVRLDRTWNVDWFAITIGEIDRFGHIHCGRTFPDLTVRERTFCRIAKLSES
jgi:hypothetical protein